MVYALQASLFWISYKSLQVPELSHHSFGFQNVKDSPQRSNTAYSRGMLTLFRKTIPFFSIRTIIARRPTVGTSPDSIHWIWLRMGLFRCRSPRRTKVRRNKVEVEVVRFRIERHGLGAILCLDR